MRRKWVILAPIFFVLFIFVGGEVVLQLWNWLAPALFGWRLITFWQAVGLLALCRILFGSIGGRGGHRSSFRGRMRERWEGMTPEERAKFREAMIARCGSFKEPGGETKAPA